MLLADSLICLSPQKYEYFTPSTKATSNKAVKCSKLPRIPPKPIPIYPPKQKVKPPSFVIPNESEKV